MATFWPGVRGREPGVRGREVGSSAMLEAVGGRPPLSTGESAVPRCIAPPELLCTCSLLSEVSMPSRRLVPSSNGAGGVGKRVCGIVLSLLPGHGLTGSLPLCLESAAAVVVIVLFV